MRNYNPEDFELHKAVFNNDFRTIHKICDFESSDHLICDINEVDPAGNTPLMLAIKMCHYDVINVLCDHDADIKHKCFDDDISPIEYAVKNENRKVIKLLIASMKKQKSSHWERNKKAVIEIIRKIPDFSIDLKLNFDSNIFHVFTQYAPCDYYKVI